MNDRAVCLQMKTRIQQKLSAVTMITLSYLWPGAAPRAAVPLMPALGDANFGPYDAAFLAGGIGLGNALAPSARPLAAQAAWSIGGWVDWAQPPAGAGILTAIGDPGGRAWRGLALRDGRPVLVLAPGVRIASPTPIEPGRWTAVMGTYDGRTARLYVDGREIAARTIATSAVAALIELAPPSAATTAGNASAGSHFGGKLAAWTLRDRALDPSRITALAAARPHFGLIAFTHVGVGWPVQQREWTGLQQPQAPWTLPRSRSGPSTPVAVAAPRPATALGRIDSSTWSLSNWRLRIAARGAPDPGGERISSVDYPDNGHAWHAAVVPGTVLTTMIARGLYPDPNYGLNNLAIPESLSHKDYWYRSLFLAPGPGRGPRAGRGNCGRANRARRPGGGPGA